MKYTVLAGRILFAFIFIMAATGHFSKETIAFSAAQGVPLASIAVPLSGITMLLGGLSVAAGFRAKWGAWILFLTMVPVTFMMHKFWNITNPMMQKMDMVMFMKNISIMGASLIVAYFGSGPASLDAVLDKKKEAQLKFQ